MKRLPTRRRGVLPLVLLVLATLACRGPAMNRPTPTVPVGATRAPTATTTLKDAPAPPPSLTGPEPSPTAPPAASRPPRPVSSPTLPAPLAGKLAAARRAWHEGDPIAALPLYRQVIADPAAPPEVWLETGAVALAQGDRAVARSAVTPLLSGDPETAARARLLLAEVDLADGDGSAALRRLQGDPPAGLEDLVSLFRARAALKSGDRARVRAELAQPALRESTNQRILEAAGQLADEVGDPDLAAAFYLRAAGFPGWTADRSRLFREAGRAFLQAGQTASAVAADRQLVETFPWTPAARSAADDLARLGALNDYDRGLLALGRRQFAAAEAALGRVTTGPDAAMARTKLAEAREAAAWKVADDAGTSAAYHAFRLDYPSGRFTSEAWFQEGLVDYQRGQLSAAVAVWAAGANASAGDARARFLLWESKALGGLGQATAARQRLAAAAATRPAGYYALRAQDLLNGALGWPSGEAASGPPAPGGPSAKQWLAGWAGPASDASPRADPGVRRGLALWELGFPAEAEVELNRVISESSDGWFLYHLGNLLASEELWFPTNRAAQRLVILSPGQTIAAAPVAVQRLYYPPAYLDRVARVAGQRGFDPGLFLALLYQESRDDPFARSLVGARGIAQMMPGTGREIAAASGQDGFTTADLNRPSVGIDYGGRFFADQLRRFRGNPFLALAAYNAGPGAIDRWASPDPDLFVERISYAETRDYVRQIYVHDAFYRRLWRE